jgi:serine O-acetyltransferase
LQAILRLHHISHALHVRGFSTLSRCVDVIIRLGFAAAIPGAATIGKNVFFHHGGIGVVLNKRVIIEEGCEIGVHVVLDSGACHLQKNVVVHAGAKIIGSITIGEGSVIAANAVVIADMPAGCLIAGIPAIVKRTDIDVTLHKHSTAKTTG